MTLEDSKLNTINNITIANAEVAILILSTRDVLYDNFKKAIINGWLSSMRSNNIKCYFYSGDYGNSCIQGDQINVSASDKLTHTSRKLLVAIDLLMTKHPEIKLVYRTNLSSYIEVENFIRFIYTRRLDENTYAGYIGKANYTKELFYGKKYFEKIFTMIPIGRRIKFASGSGFFIGSNNISKLLKSTPHFMRLIDDVMVAKTLAMEPNEKTSPLRFDIMENDLHKISKSTYDSLLKEGSLFHYRFKTSDRTVDAKMLESFSDPTYRYDCCTLS